MTYQCEEIADSLVLPENNNNKNNDKNKQKKQKQKQDTPDMTRNVKVTEEIKPVSD